MLYSLMFVHSVGVVNLSESCKCLFQNIPVSVQTIFFQSQFQLFYRIVPIMVVIQKAPVGAKRDKRLSHLTPKIIPSYPGSSRFTPQRSRFAPKYPVLPHLHPVLPQRISFYLATFRFASKYIPFNPFYNGHIQFCTIIPHFAPTLLFGRVKMSFQFSMKFNLLKYAAMQEEFGRHLFAHSIPLPFPTQLNFLQLVFYL